MGDMMFAAEGGSGNVGRNGPQGFVGGSGGPAPADDAQVGVMRRLQGRLDRQLWLLGRLRDGRPEPRAVTELLETARRMRRDSESLLLLGGADPNVRIGGARLLADVLGDAVAATEEPHRVVVDRIPQVTLAPAAATEVLHLVAELVDHAAAAHAAARVEVAGRIEPDGGLLLELQVGPGAVADPDAPGARRSAVAADRLAARSRFGLGVRRPALRLPGEPVAAVSCPAAVVTVEEPPLADGGDRFGPGGRPRTNGGGLPLRSPSSVQPGLGHRPGPGKVDELFGPLVDLPYSPMDDAAATPIYEAIASAWFSDADRSGPGEPELDWESPGDREWRAAAERANRTSTPVVTASGLPRRRPGDRLVPPPRANGRPADGPAERVPDRVRDRLATYQRGLEQGRHRAEPFPGDPGPGGSGPR